MEWRIYKVYRGQRYTYDDYVIMLHNSLRVFDLSVNTSSFIDVTSIIDVGGSRLQCHNVAMYSYVVSNDSEWKCSFFNQHMKHTSSSKIEDKVWVSLRISARNNNMSLFELLVLLKNKRHSYVLKASSFKQSIVFWSMYWLVWQPVHTSGEPSECIFKIEKQM